MTIRAGQNLAFVICTSSNVDRLLHPNVVHGSGGQLVATPEYGNDHRDT